MTDRASSTSSSSSSSAASKPLTWQDWESLIDDFQHGGARLQRWTSEYPIPSLVDLGLISLLKKDFPLRLALIIFLEEFSLTLFTNPKSLDRLIETLRFVVQSPVDNFHITYALKDQFLISTTSILISVDVLKEFEVRYLENVVELLLTVINRPNHGLDRHTRAVACECLRQFEVYCPGLLSDIAGHLWTLCQSERTHASQSYILLLTNVIYNIVDRKLNVSVLNTSVPLVPFNVPQLALGSNLMGLNFKELRRAMAFLLEWTQVLTPCGMLEFLRLVLPVAVALELQPSMLKVQFFGMIYSYDLVLCHAVLMMYLHLFDSFDGQECEIVQRLMLISKETQHHLVFRLLAVHWVLGLLNKLMSSKEVAKKNSILELGLRFYLSVFDPLALKALKLDLLAFCTIFLDMLKKGGDSIGEVGDGKSVVKLFEDSLVSVSAFKWLPPSSSETAVAYRTFHKFLIGASSHFDADPSTTRILMETVIFHALQKHGPNTGLKSWSQGSRVLGNCRTMLKYHRSSRLFIGLSRLLAFTCLYFPDLEIRDRARIYLRLLICVPGGKLRDILNLGEQLLGVPPSQHSTSFFNVQSPRHYQDIKKFKNISSYVHLERAVPLLVKQFWSLSLSTTDNKSGFLDSIRDTEPPVDEREHDGSIDHQIMSQRETIDQPLEPLRVMDSKISEILGLLRRHFSCIPDFRHMAGLKVSILCSLRFESEPFNRLWGDDSTMSGIDGVDALPAIYATVLKFSSSAPYGSIPSCRIPFLLGEPARKGSFSDQTLAVSVIPVENGSRDKESFRAPVTIDLEPREPTPGLVDVFIETNAENGQIIYGQLHSITVGIEDMFLKAIAPPDITEDEIPGYYSDLFSALWEACGNSSNTGREIFSLKGGKGVAAIKGIQSVKLLEVPANSVIRATERYLAQFVVSVIGEQFVDIVKDGGIIRDVIWKDVGSDSFLDGSTSVTDVEQGPLHLTYIGDEDEGEIPVKISKRNMGCFLVLIFLPPRYHLLFRMEVCDISTLVRIRTDHWPCLAYVDDYLEALFFA
ncbi:AP-5 complex subunit beta-1 [Citrus sinensis]|uniref:AP-5 complex subunit beta-1 n=1 Tax=Citrus sinensis TaxID=2711 RepID=A0ACB8LDB7_CITSI|nr:AP-5 complex subunit beta-1 [Citrus sinensis]